MEYDLKVAEGNLMYLRKEIVELMGEKLKGITGYKAMLIFPRDADWETVKRSLNIISMEIENRINEQQSQSD